MTDLLTRDIHRAEAIRLYNDAQSERLLAPARMALIAEAQLHATLALTAPFATTQGGDPK